MEVWGGLLQMWSVWDTSKYRHFFGAQKGRRRPFLFFASWSPGLLMSGAHHRQDTVKTKVHEWNFTRPVFIHCIQNNKHCIKGELRLLTDVDSSHFPLAFHISLQIHKHTHRDSLYHCGVLHTHNTPTTMTWQGLHHAGAYIYSTAIYPWALTAHRLCHCGVAGHHSLSVCPSAALSVFPCHRTTWMADEWLILDQGQERSQRCFEGTRMVEMIASIFVWLCLAGLSLGVDGMHIHRNLYFFGPSFVKCNLQHR